MYLELQRQLAGHLRSVLQAKYSIEIENVPVEIPPDLRFGELATPIALQLARTLRKAPKVIALEIVEAIGTLPGFAGFEVAGAGYINARLDRAAGVRSIADSRPSDKDKGVARMGHPEHVLVEHTSINPNKAAHIGHLRNAILGDTFVRLLRAAGNQVDVQNYIDNTGVQVADVVVGFQHLEGKSLAEVRALLDELKAHGERVDYYCWDLYARTSQWYEQGSAEENAERKKFRYATLHAIEEGGNETAEVAELISTAVLRRHLETMLRLDIEYDFLPRESEILHLKFWDVAFEQLKQTGVLYFETEGKNKGCWVMQRPGAEIAEGELDEDAKVIVRSNGTVTYVGKDIAYHLWKFGLLGRDFGYKKFFKYPDHECWISTEHGEAEHPHFGGATAIYNVIDSRQSDPQANVIQALRGMGHTAQADHYTHFSYEMVALTPRCAVDLGYTVSDEDLSRPYIEVSGRKGFGVKADDLIDKLIAATREEVEKRQTSRDEAERQRIAEQVAIGALRYFMLKFTRNSVIAFDFKDALSFEGETGPYAQYAAVRIRNIFRKGGTTPEAELARLAEIDELGSYLSGEENEDIWALWLRAGRRSLVLDQAIGASEPAYLAKHAFQLAQEFNNFYHKHHILTEEDAGKKTFLLATAAVAFRELVTVLGWLGIETPEAM
ncbi:arginine--tRNA ligase [Terracidiphilus sp.]|uniref:arginine--tRNA ligase n=1 Tax=Terracidiphilus sp. TaxID=1964191 RepID=UPI003C26D9EA